jgi:DNA-directed RNA polymerase specialized sigma24 family protein
MNTIGYRNRFYQARQTWPRLDSPKASAQSANELRAANEQGPPLVTPETPDSANSLNPSSKASSVEVFRQCLEDDLTSAGDIARKMGVSKGTVSKMAKRAMKEGWLKKQGREYAMI